MNATGKDRGDRLRRMKPFLFWAAFGFVVWATTAHAVVLSGTVTRSDGGEAVTDARVLVRGTGMHVTTNADGYYSIPLVPAGWYGITCSAPELVGVSTAAVDLDEDAVHDFALVSPAEGTLSVSGTVLGDGVGRAGVLVLARQENRTVARSLSAPDGAFSIPGLSEGEYDFWAVALGYLPAEQTGVQVIADPPPVIELDLAGAPRTYTLNGHVGLSDNPLYLDGSSVRVFGQSAVISAATTPGGAFRLDGVPAGLLSLAATHQGYDWHLRIDVLVPDDSVVDFVLQRQGGNGDDPTYRVDGTVYLADPAGGDPVVAFGSRVSLFSTDGEFVRTTATDIDGRYAIYGAQAGSYRIGAAREGYLSRVEEPFSLDANRSVDFELQPDPDYDWGPGAEDGELGCGCGVTSAQSGWLALLLFSFFMLLRGRNY